MRLIFLLSLALTCYSNASEVQTSNNAPDISLLSSNAIEGLFKKYSNKTKSISAHEFEAFLNRVIETLVPETEDASENSHDHDHDHTIEPNHVHEHTTELGHDHGNGLTNDYSHDQSAFNNNCFKEKLKQLQVVANNNDKSINKEHFSQLSSIFVSDLDSCIPETHQVVNSLVIYDNSTFIERAYKMKENWIWAFLSAFIITVIGLLCYLIVPSLNALCFNYLFQFLVALAVGTLTGDALLHLIPHAFTEHKHGSQSDHSHTDGVYKGLGAVVGIYMFFLIERIMQIRRARKEKRHRHDELDAEGRGQNYDKVQQPDLDDKKIDLARESIDKGSNKSGGNEVYSNELQSLAKRADLRNKEEEIHIVIHGNKDLKYISKYLPNNKCGEDVDHHDHENEIEHLHQHSAHILANDQSALLISNKTRNCKENDNCNKLNPRLEKKSSHNSSNHLNDEIHSHGHSHGHGHGHSHSHKYKSSREKAHHDHHKKHEREISDIKLIAWMVLMGDGLHNFSDGLAIGASFASSLTTGFGTAIAVLCHELPHEIGDFAVLRRAGVSLQRALVFNAISGVLCMIGTFVGLIIGGFMFLSNWAFLFIAGTFLYISLVDMIPELSENKDDDSIVNFLLQSFGILVGIGIMLAIALLEDKIVKIFT